MVAAMRYGNPIRPHEVPVVTKILLNAKTTFMHQRVMPGAQQHEVIQARLATIRPMLNMVTMQVTTISTAGESAAVVVSGPQGSLNRCRHNAGLAANAQWLALVIFGDHNGMAVTAKSFD